MNTQTEPDTKYTELDAAIAALPVTYSAAFVPQSLSRNAGEKHRSLNWRVTIVPTAPGKTPLICDYMQGIGHVPGLGGWQKRTISVTTAEYEASEKGVYSPPGKSSFHIKKVLAPLARDVFYSLVRDADVLDAHCFEDWAADFGMDTDSRAAERTYQTCVTQSRALVALIGYPALAQLRELFQDY